MLTPCLAIMSSIILRCSGGMEAICFCICSMAASISGLPPILLLISHKPGRVLWAWALKADAVRVAMQRTCRDLRMKKTPLRLN